jgi:hypothetical protein
MPGDRIELPTRGFPILFRQKSQLADFIENWLNLLNILGNYLVHEVAYGSCMTNNFI